MKIKNEKSENIETKIFKKFLRHPDVKARLKKLEREETIFKKSLTKTQKLDFEKILLQHLIVDISNSIELIETALRYKVEKM